VNRLIGNLKIWQKFALVLVLVLPMVAVPTAIVVKNDWAVLATAQSEAYGIVPAAAVIRLIQLTQQHRGASAGFLSGDDGLKAEREAKQDETQQALVSALALSARFSSERLKTHSAQIAHDWRALTTAVIAKSLTAPESIERHTDLITAQLDLLEDIAADSQLALDPEAASYYLITTMTIHLPRMSESLGLARGRGTAILTKGVASPEERASIGALAERVRLHFRDGKTALQRAIDDDPSLKGILDQPVAAALLAAESALKLVDENIVRPEAMKFPAHEYLDAMTRAIDQQFGLIATVNGALGAILSDRVQSTRRELLTIGVMVAALSALASWCIFVVSRITARHVDDALRLATALAQGDLTQKAHTGTRDEIGQVVTAIEAAMTALAQVIIGIKHSSESVSTAAAQIAAGNLDLSGRTEEQAASLEQTAGAMEQLTSTVKHSADSARQASQLALSASAAASQGGAAVGNVVATMNEISSSSRKITEITSVIDGIAFQTNILALNAAVEAARAGEQGRGFAVVAGEVRSLAQRSAEAAREIKALIGDSVDKVENGSRLVNDAGAAMSNIVAQVKRATDLIGEISNAGTEQSAGISLVSDAVAQMDRVTQQNAALVEQSAAAAAGLREQADHLALAVAAFKVAQSETRHALAPAQDATRV